MKKIAFIAIALFAVGSMFSSCCCDDANAPKLPPQPKFKDLPAQAAPVAPVQVYKGK